jgi:hypothetical protein
MATIPELLDGHVTLEIECLDRLYLNGYIGKLATGPGLMMFMRGQLGKPVPSPVVLGQVSEKFREAVKTQADRQQVPMYQFRHKERKDDIANDFRRERQVRDGMVFIGVAQEKAQAFNGKKVKSASVHEFLTARHHTELGHKAAIMMRQGSSRRRALLRRA